MVEQQLFIRGVLHKYYNNLYKKVSINNNEIIKTPCIQTRTPVGPAYTYK